MFMSSPMTLPCGGMGASHLTPSRRPIRLPFYRASSEDPGDLSKLPIRRRSPSSLRPASVSKNEVTTVTGRDELLALHNLQLGYSEDELPMSSPFPWKPRRRPDAEVLEIWHSADAVCFDIDCTIVKNDGLDLLAEFMGVGDKVEALTTKAMDGSMSLDTSLEERLKILDCTPEDIKRFLKAHPPETRINEGAKKLVSALKARGIEVYLISGGFREILLPIAKYLGIPSTHVVANRMNWQWDELTGEPTKLVGFDKSQPTSRNNGKPEVIARLRKSHPYNNIVMVGDGVTDLEAATGEDGADLFIGYGGNVQRSQVMLEADWFVMHFDELFNALKQHKVAVIGGGAFACAAMHVISQSLSEEDPANLFQPSAKMWIRDSEFEGRRLSEHISSSHENPKYLPGVSLGESTVIEPNLLECVKDADILVFCVPHQFIHGICKKLIGKVKEDAIAISLTKGMRVRTHGPQLVSQMVTKMLGIDCSVLMGANIAEEIGREELTEAVIGYYNRNNAKMLARLFERDYFNVSLLHDAPGAEMCGTLKNVVAIGAGLVEGLGYGSNTKSAILREGLAEMRKFSKALYPMIRDETFLETCGIADLIATCYGGRNRRCAEAWARSRKEGTPKSFSEVEAEMLGGQKLQGTLTADEVYEILEQRGWELEYPLFTTIYRIIHGKIPVEMIVKYREGARMKLQEEGLALKKRNPLPTIDLLG